MRSGTAAFGKKATFKPVMNKDPPTPLLRPIFSLAEGKQAIMSPTKFSPNIQLSPKHIIMQNKPIGQPRKQDRNILSDASFSIVRKKLLMKLCNARIGKLDQIP